MGRDKAYKPTSEGSERSGLSLMERYFAVRKHSEFICEPLSTEDFVVQPTEDVSPPKWHLAHTTWFFEEIILSKFLTDYERFHPRYSFLFNSYYEGMGDRIARPYRGALSRPSVADIFEYRAHVDQHMIRVLSALPAGAEELIELGINHEQQHQELLYTDIKYILGNNPLYPIYNVNFQETPKPDTSAASLEMPTGLYTIGNNGKKFCFDHEQPEHQVHLNAFSIAQRLVTNREYLDFIEDGGYKRHALWLSDAWALVKEKRLSKPLYWIESNGTWYRYALSGLEKLNPHEPVTHVSYYEAAAFAEWKGMRLPTEFEWEAAAPQLNWGLRWEYTNSAFLAYPGYRRPADVIGEYNGKFMINTMVLRGSSIVTPLGHARATYRNFFYPHQQWQFSGIRLCQHA